MGLLHTHTHTRTQSTMDTLPSCFSDNHLVGQRLKSVPQIPVFECHLRLHHSAAPDVLLVLLLLLKVVLQTLVLHLGVAAAIQEQFIHAFGLQHPGGGAAIAERVPAGFRNA